MAKGKGPDNSSFFKKQKDAADAFLQANAKGKGTAKVAGPGGPTAKLVESVNIGYGFEIDSVDFMATDQAYFQIAAQLTLAIRPAFRRAVEQLRKIIPKMIREQLDKSRVIQDLKRQESQLVAALGLADSASSASSLVDHIVKSVRVRITTATEVAGKSEFQVPQIVWGVAEDKLMSVGGWGSYSSYPSRDSINWAVWLLSNSYRSSGHRIKFGSFSGRQSRTRSAIMIPGGSFSLDQYIDPYEVNFVEAVIDENLAVKVDQVAEKIITSEIAKVSEVDIGKTAGLLQARAGKLLSLTTESGGEFDDKSLQTGPDVGFDITTEQLKTLQELASLGLITVDEVKKAQAGDLNIDDLLGRR